MNRFDDGWLPVKAGAHQSWSPKKEEKEKINEQRTMSNPEREKEEKRNKLLCIT